MSKKLREKRAKVLLDQRALLDKADEEKRGLTAEEREQYDKYDKEFDTLTEQIKTADADEARKKKLEDRENLLDQPLSDPLETPEGQGGGQERSDEYGDVFWRRMRSRDGAGLSTEEHRALQVGTDSEGGYLVPDEFYKRLIDLLQDANIMRSLCTVIRTSNGTTELPVVSSHGAAAWIAEEGAFTEGDDAFTQVTLSAYKVGTIMKVSEELINDSVFNLDTYIAKEYARRIGVAEEAAFVSGDGSSKPTGIDEAIAAGVTAASASAITSDELIDLFHSLGRAYRKGATFLMADGTAKVIRKLKDGNDQYLWQPGLKTGQPDTLLGKRVEISENVAAIAASAKSILFADFSYYWIADRQGMVMQRLNELYAATGQVGYKAYQRVDGKMTLAAAGKHLAMAAA